MSKSKPRVIKDYDNLSSDIKEQIKLVYPKGFSNHLVSFVNKDGETRMGLPFETEDYIYLIRMQPTKAAQIIEDDDDYDDDGVLKESVQQDYADKHEDADYLSFNSNEDNELGAEEETDSYKDEFEDDYDDDDFEKDEDEDQDEHGVEDDY